MVMYDFHRAAMGNEEEDSVEVFVMGAAGTTVAEGRGVDGTDVGLTSSAGLVAVLRGAMANQSGCSHDRVTSDSSIGR